MNTFKSILFIAAVTLSFTASAAEKIYFVQTDHLGSPEMLTDDNQTIVWQASQDPFANSAPITEQVNFDFRFPGQYYDAESGLFYNWNRYYDAGTGRYVTSDPIGLGGGLNTFGYVGGNPILNYDPNGLDSVTAYCRTRPGECALAGLGVGYSFMAMAPPVGDGIREFCMAVPDLIFGPTLSSDDSPSNGGDGLWPNLPKPDIEGPFTPVDVSSPPPPDDPDKEPRNDKTPDQRARERGAELVKKYKNEGVGQGAGRSGGHGTPHQRAGAELIREANKLPKKDPLRAALKKEGKRLIERGSAINHR